MRSRRALAACAIAGVGFLAACADEHAPRSLEAGRMGRVELYSSPDGHEGFVYLFSDARGWSRDLDQVARRLADHGAAVVGVDLPRYLAALVATREDECHYTVAELEDW